MHHNICVTHIIIILPNWLNIHNRVYISLAQNMAIGQNNFHKFFSLLGSLSQMHITCSISSTVNGAEVAFSELQMHSILNATCVTIAVSACMRLLYLLCPYSANQYQTQKTVRLHLLIIKQNILNISQFANHFINLYHETQNNH